jgi:hypothetical protein
LQAPDTTYYDETGGAVNWYEVSFYDSVSHVESDKCAAFQGDDVTTYYTTPARVAARLQIRNSQNLAEFDGQTHPTVTEVIEMIREVEDTIDSTTNHAWREKYAYDTGDANDYEMHHLDKEYVYLVGIPVFLKHRHIRQQDHTKGDSMQIWNGSEYEEWLTARTEGRDKDYWIDYRQGIVHIRTYVYRKRPWGFQMRYRYGETVVPEEIKQAATYLVCANIARLEDRSFLIPEGSSNVPIKDKMDEWEKQAREILNRRKEMPVAMT